MSPESINIINELLKASLYDTNIDARHAYHNYKTWNQNGYKEDFKTIMNDRKVYIKALREFNKLINNTTK